MSEKEDDSGQDGLIQAIQKTYENFQKNELNLEKLPAEAKTAFEKIMEKINEVKDVFENPEQFYALLVSKETNLSDVEGNLEHLTLEMELKREIIRRPDRLVDQLAQQMKQRTGSDQKLPATINVQTGEPQKQKGGSFYDWRIAVAQSNLVKEQLRQLANAPTLTTAQKPRDVLDYARDIVAEFNKLVDYFHRGLAMVKTFPQNKETREFMNEEIRCFLVKLGNVITSFSRAVAEYRKELNGERAESYALALTMVKQAEYAGIGGMSQSEMYRMMRQGMGPENAGG